jgi:hypothetical protein
LDKILYEVDSSDIPRYRGATVHRNNDGRIILSADKSQTETPHEDIVI